MADKTKTTANKGKGWTPNYVPWYPPSMTDDGVRRWLPRPSKDAKNENKFPFSIKTGKSFGWANEAYRSNYKEVTTYRAENPTKVGGESLVVQPNSNDDEWKFLYLDIDHAFDKNGEPLPWIAALLNTHPTFVEFSQSGTGLHPVYKYRGPALAGMGQKNNVGVNTRGQMAATGNVCGERRDVAEIDPADLEKALAHVGFKARPYGSPDAKDFDASGIWDCHDDPLPKELRTLEVKMRNFKPSISGQGGHNTLFAAACHCYEATVDITARQVLRLLRKVPADPPWSFKELVHKVEDAYRLAKRDFAMVAPVIAQDDVDKMLAEPPVDDDEDDNDTEDEVDLGAQSLPKELIDEVPGYIRARVKTIMETARYPASHFAFAAANIELSLAGSRRFTDHDGTSLTVAFLCMGPSGRGKNHARRCVMEIMIDVGIDDQIGEKVTGRQALEDRLMEYPVRTMIPDEFHSVIKSAANARDPLASELPAYLNTVLTQGDSYLIPRDKAGDQGSGSKSRIAKPVLLIMATSTRNAFYEALNKEMAEDGLLGRLIALEGEPRGRFNRAKKPFHTPPKQAAFIRYLYEMFKADELAIREGLKPDEDKDDRLTFEKRRRSLFSTNPYQWVFARCPSGIQAYEAFCDKMDDAYSECERNEDNLGCAVYGRASEQMNGFALRYTLSALYDKFIDDPECYQKAYIEAEAVEWAIKVVEFLVEQKVHRARNRRPDSEYTRKSDRVINALRSAGGRLSRSRLVDRTRLTVEELFGFDTKKGAAVRGGVVGTLIEAKAVREVDTGKVSRNGKPATHYEIIEKGKP
jgi:hypothetical protein